jgi:hypothetical protein
MMEEIIIWSFIICTLQEILLVNQIEEDVMGEHMVQMGEMRELCTQF